MTHDTVRGSLSPMCHSRYIAASSRIGMLGLIHRRLIAMQYLWSLFTRKSALRQFALLDSQGRCQAFKECSQPPVGQGWVEIEEIRLSWMHRPLPARARVSPRATRSSRHPVLAA